MVLLPEQWALLVARARLGSQAEPASGTFHRLSDLDIENKRATCEVCGPVDIYLKPEARRPGPRPRCATKARQKKRESERRRARRDPRVRDRKDRIVKRRRFPDAPPPPESCPICEGVGTMCQDHDHRTGKFRGWVCIACNSGMGMFGDDPQRMLRAIGYLEEAI